MTDYTNNERQRRYMAKLKAAAAKGVSNGPSVDPLLTATQQELAKAQAEIERLRDVSNAPGISEELTVEELIDDALDRIDETPELPLAQRIKLANALAWLSKESGILEWWEFDSDVDGHSVYCDHPDGPSYSRYEIEPVKGKGKNGRFLHYNVLDEHDKSLGTAKTPEEAQAVAQAHSDEWATTA